MRLIAPSVEVIKQTVNYNMYRHLAECYAYIYKLPKPDSMDECRKLTDLAEINEDYDVLKHTAVYMIFPLTEFYINKYGYDPKCSVYEDFADDKFYVTTTYDYIVKNNHFGDLQYTTPYNLLHERYVTVKFSLDQLGMQNLCRMGDKFMATCVNRFNFRDNDPKLKNEVKFIIPSFVTLKPGLYLQSKENDQIVYKCAALGTVCKPCTDNLGVSEEMFKTFNVDEQMKHTELVRERNINFSFLNRRYENEQAYNHLLGTDLFTPQACRNVMHHFGEEHVIVTAAEYDWTAFINRKFESLSGPSTKMLFTQIKEQL